MALGEWLKEGEGEGVRMRGTHGAHKVCVH